jgi:hypothetical protein
MSDRTSAGKRNARDEIVRWECHCQSPPVLLGTHDASGKVHIKVRDRYWHIIGIVKTTCPKCGSEHILSPDQSADGSTDLLAPFEVTRS